jgi:hypothetical protein
MLMYISIHFHVQGQKSDNRLRNDCSRERHAIAVLGGSLFLFRSGLSMILLHGSVLHGTQVKVDYLVVKHLIKDAP